MPFWSRGRPSQPEWARQLTSQQEARFRETVDSLLRPLGHPYEWTDIGLRLSIADGQDTIAALARIAGLYAKTTESARAALLAEHFAALLATPDLPKTWRDAEPHLGVRLFARDALVGELGRDVWRVLTDSVVAALTIQDAKGEGTLSGADLERWNVTREAAWHAAMRNVHAEPLLADERTPLAQGGEIRAMFSASPRGAARAIELDRYVDTPSSMGAVMSVPDRGVVIFHTIQSRESFEAAVSFMASVGASLFGAPDSDPLSPDLHWWRNGLWTTITYVDRQGAFRRKPNDELDRHLQGSAE